MKILAIQGSPQPEGNTRVILGAVLSAAAEAGAVVETAQVSELECLSGCDECAARRRCVSCPVYGGEWGTGWWGGIVC